MKTFLLRSTALIATGFAIIPSAMAESSSLPVGYESLEQAITQAFATNNSFVIDSVVYTAKETSPEIAAQIDTFLQGLYTNAPSETEASADDIAAAETDAEANQLADIAPSAGDEKEKNWKGSVELGAAVQTGNTEQETLNFNSELIHEFKKWGNTLKLSANSAKQNSVRSSEEYRGNNQTRYNLSKKDYAFLELDYVNDRFGGYEYRTTELVGYGRKLIDEEKMKLVGEASVGARQTSFLTGTDENNFVTKLRGDFDWEIRDGLSFEEDASISFSDDATITESTTALKAALTEAMYIKLGFTLENISDVPVGTEETDTKTTVTVGYDF